MTTDGRVATAGLLTTTQAAAKLRCSPRTVARDAARKPGDPQRLEYVHKLPGGRGAYLFDPEYIEAEARRRLAPYIEAAKELEAS